MNVARHTRAWPLLGQLRGDPLGLGRAGRSGRSRELRARIAVVRVSTREGEIDGG